jgi:hypothetical protein
VQSLLFTTDLLIALGERAAEAAAGGEETFALPEFEPVAAVIAADRRAAVAGAARRWASEGASYHELVRLCARYVMELETAVPVCDTAPVGESVYVPKACDELEPLLALWPHVLALPTVDSFTARDFIRLRAFPVHPLGVTSEVVWADGRQVSPAEFFFHDVDHARFKVREDLLATGVEIPDAYQDGTTFDSATGRHRSILPEALSKVGPALWSMANERLNLIESVLRRMDALPDHSLAQAAEWLLFQILHEKSFALDVPTLRRELATLRHVELLQMKVSSSFYEKNTPSVDVMVQLNTARYWLMEVLS